MEVKMGELAYEQLLKVACRLDKKSDIRKLGFKLGVKEHKINSIFTNKNDDIEEAVYEMLKEWRKGQRDNREAYTKLWAALTHPDVNLQSVAHEALTQSDHDILDDYYGVQEKRLQQEKKRRENEEKINYLFGKTSESEMCESHLDEVIHCIRQRLEEQDDDTIPVRPGWWEDASLLCRVLTEQDLERIAAEMDKKDMDHLGEQLNISSKEIDESFAEHCPPPRKAIHEILKRWLKRQNNRHEAYIKLGEALIHPNVGLNLIATEVLDYPPAKNISYSCAESASKKCAQGKGTHGTGGNSVVASC